MKKTQILIWIEPEPEAVNPGGGGGGGGGGAWYVGLYMPYAELEGGAVPGRGATLLTAASMLVASVEGRAEAAVKTLW
jgi:hypothetical protein